MWKLTEIYAQNICAFREIQYTLKQGVTTLIFGDNRDNESQRSNGSGKSALIECIAIGITGSPLRKIKNEEIINDNSDECLIELQFRNINTDEQFMIERKLFRKDTAEIACYIFRDGKFEADEAVQHSNDAYNKYILDKLGITKDELYNNFILSKHKYQDFLSSPDKDKKEIINRFSNGILVDDAIESIKKDIIPFSELLKKLELEFAGIEGRVNMLVEQIGEEENNKQEKAKTKEEKILSLNESIAHKRSLIREYSDNLSLLETNHIEIKEADTHIQDLENKDCTLDDYLTGIETFLPKSVRDKMTDWSSVILNKKKNIEQAGKELANWDDVLKSAELKIQEVTGIYNVLFTEYQQFERDSNEKSDLCDVELQRLSRQYMDVYNDIEKQKKTRRAISSAIELLNNKLAGLISCPACGFEFILAEKDFDVEKGKVDVEENKEKYITLSSKINGDEELMSRLEKERQEKEEEKRSLGKQMRIWSDKLDAAEREVKIASHEMEGVKQNQKRIAENVTTLNEEIDGMLRKIFDEAFDLIDEAYKVNSRKQKSVQEEINTVENSIDTLEQTIKEIENHSENDLLASLRKSLAEYRTKSNDILLKKTKIEEELKTLERQEQNFIEFKTYLANTKIEALSQITNEFLEDIGSDIRIRFSGYTVLKSGKVREKISISLLRNGLDCGSFGKFSAGEAARVNLATILAMQKLINSNCDMDKGMDLLVLDEILEAVDEEGLAFMFEALNRIAVTALVVSHGNIAESYPHTVKIIKENGESRISE